MAAQREQKMNKRISGLTAMAVLVAISAIAVGQDEAGRGHATAGKCTALNNLRLPGVTITSANRVTAAAQVEVEDQAGAASPAGLPPYCRFDGVINQRTGSDGKRYGIGFALALPDSWNGRFLLQGGGGFNGSVLPPIGAAAAGLTPALARGFAVASHDSGHKGAGFDASFVADQRAMLDFAESSVPTVTNIAKAITEHFYGRPISRSYMAGCSTGGREAMLASQRYPEMFDGIVVGAPAMRTSNSNLARAWGYVQFNQAAPRDSRGLPIVDRIFSPADRKLYQTSLLAQCDALDGLEDGQIGNVGACRFKPALRQCRGKKAEGCFSVAQVKALEAAFRPPRDTSGRALYAAFPNDTGNVVEGPGIPGFLPTGKPDIFGPANRDLKIDLDARIAEIRADAGQRLIDTNVWTNLNTFTDHGGKILFYHGVSDPWFSAFDTLDYWQRAEKANESVWPNVSRFYMVPGMGHCSGGDAYDTFDLLSAVVDWVEKGKAPGSIVAKRSLPAKGERPLCPWPSYPHYVGGPQYLASSFTCRKTRR